MDRQLTIILRSLSLLNDHQVTLLRQTIISLNAAIMCKQTYLLVCTHQTQHTILNIIRCTEVTSISRKNDCK